MPSKIWCPMLGRKINVRECETCEVKGKCGAYAAYHEEEE